MNASQMLAQKSSRRSFLKRALLAGGGLTLATAATPMATSAATGTRDILGEAADISVWTGWTARAAKDLKKILNSHKGSRKMVSARHVVVPDNLVQRQLAAIALNDALDTEYFVTMSRTATQPRSHAEADQIVHNLSVWQVRRPTAADSQPGNVVEKAYSISFRDATLIRNAMNRGSETLSSQSPEILRRYHKLVA